MIHQALPHELAEADRVACRAYAEYEKEFPGWAALRFMAVDHGHRRRGVARALAQECVRLAKRDGAQVLGLLTSPAMTTAFALYLKMGFRHERDMAPVMGMPARVLALRLAD